MKKPDDAHYDASINTGDEFFVRYKMILGHELGPAEVAARRASGKQEFRYSPEGKGVDAMRAEAERLLAAQPDGADVSLTYAPSKNRTGAENPAENEQRRAVEYVKAWYDDPKLQRMFNGIDSAGIEDANRPPATRWESSAQRTFRNAIVMREHLASQLRRPADVAAIAERIARITGETPQVAADRIERYRAAGYEGALEAS